MGVLSKSEGVGTSSKFSWTVGEATGATFVGVFWVGAFFLHIGVGGVMGGAFNGEKM